MPPLDVLVDLTTLTTPSRCRGIGRYAASLSLALAALDDRDRQGLRIGAIRRFVGAGRVVPEIGWTGPPGEQKYTLHTNIRVVRLRRALVGSLARKAGARLLHLPDPQGAPLDRRTPRVVTCHDLIPLLFWREYVGRWPWSRRLREWQDRLRYAGAARLLVPSEATRRDLCVHLGFDERRIDVTPLGVDHERFRPRGAGREANPEAGSPDAEERADAERVAALTGNRPFLLYVGGVDPRKNIELMVHAVARVGGDPLLLFAGWLTPRGRAKVQRLVARAGIAHRTRLCGYVDDATVASLYRNAAAVLFASRYEGFGLPALEAMACGAPTITTHAGSLAEVVGDAALVVDADDVDDMSNAIRRVLDDRALADDLRRRGPARAATFTWRRCALETVSAYRRALD
jgi:glycosyltransferase involved in cell wall biosynthesis